MDENITRQTLLAALNQPRTVAEVAKIIGWRSSWVKPVQDAIAFLVKTGEVTRVDEGGKAKFKRVV